MSNSSETARPLTLVSGSPRRRHLLELAGFDIEVCPANVDETLPAKLALGEAALFLARKKMAAHPVARGLRVSADTLVAIGDKILAKPADAQEAQAMIGLLSGRVHHVVTGFVVAQGQAQVEEAVVTEVAFRELSADEIMAYVARGESLDKAGAYAIQGDGASLVRHISGSLTNVIGLPVAEVLRAIENSSKPPRFG